MTSDETVPYTIASDERSQVVAALSERFGIELDVFLPYAFVRVSKKYLSVVARDHDVPDDLRAQSSGIPFMRMNLRHPKLTTAAALLFGRHATRNVVPLDYAAARAYVRRQDLQLGAEMPPSCTGPGYVLVRWERTPLGLGLLLSDGAVFRLKSLYPGRWSPTGQAPTPGGSET